MKNLLFLLLPLLVFAQRGKTGDSPFAHRLPADVKQKGTRSELLIINQTDHVWQFMIQKGFKECMRVLKPQGTLIFKWNEYEINSKQVLDLIPYKPLFGHTSGKQAKTIWMAFMKGIS